MANSKIELASGDVLMDLSADTVNPDVLAEGYTAHDKAGNPIVGRMAGIEMVRLWENASPGSSFSPQTVSVNATGCAFLLVEMKYRNDLTSGALFLAPIGKKFGARQVSSVSVSNPQYASRFIEAGTNGVVFGEGYDQGPTTTQDNAYAIPTAIYGVKGAS